MKVREEIEVGKLFELLKIKEQGEYKAPKSLKVKTTDGFKKVEGLMKTQLNPEWVVETESGRKAIFADFHRIEVSPDSSPDEIDRDRSWKFVNNLKIGDVAYTVDAPEKITKVFFNGKYSHMYDIQVEETKSYFTNGFNSHNTLIMGNMAINAFSEGKKALVFSFETSAERLLMRYFNNIASMETVQINSDGPAAVSKLKTIFTEDASYSEGDLIIKEYPANSVSSLELQAFTNDLIMYKNWKPDVIFVDYILIMQTNDKGLSSDNSFKYYKTISEELRNIGKAFNCPIVTACQISREGMGEKGGSKSHVSAKNIAESRGIFDTCDFFAGIIQTASDKTNEKLALYIDKNRNGETGSKIDFNVDYKKMRLTPR